MGNADKSPIPRGSLEFMQIKCDKGGLEHLTLAPCDPISSGPGAAAGWLGSGMCTSGTSQLMRSGEDGAEQEVILGQSNDACLLRRALALYFPVASAL